MCGIIGFLSKEKDTRKMLTLHAQSIKARGIHFNAYFTKTESYGYARLPTDNISNKTLNKIEKKDGHILLFNGLITNVDNLCDMFNLPSQARDSDAECLSIGFAKYREKFLAKCRGMFAFAYITKEETILVRDTIGIKPLYYSQRKDSFGFASEIKGLLTSQKVEEVLPGEIIIFNKKTGKIKKKTFSFKSYKHYKKQDLEKCLIEASVVPTLRYLKQSNKDIAILLSGGLDSSVIVMLLIENLPKYLRKRIVGFSIGIRESKDVQIAQKLAQQLGIRHICVKPYTPKQSIVRLEKIVYDVESTFPRVVRVALLQDVLAREIKKQGIDIVISGEGADELFYGYERFIQGLLPRQVSLLFKYFFTGVFYYTLLQRYERIFARHQIEGRVPFLDQELIALSQKYSIDEKIYYFGTHYEVKIPLRELAHKLKLPDYIAFRKKEKMTQGATNKINAEEEGGYLEKEIFDLTGKHFSYLIQEIYKNKFKDILSVKERFTEKEAVEMVEEYKKENKQFALERTSL